jgi:hypothetical protein
MHHHHFAASLMEVQRASKGRKILELVIRAIYRGRRPLPALYLSCIHSLSVWVGVPFSQSLHARGKLQVKRKLE